MKRRVIGWLDEELAWIEANRTRPRAELHSAFCFRFGRKDVSLSALNGLCKRKGWLTTWIEEGQSHRKLDLYRNGTESVRYRDLINTLKLFRNLDNERFIPSLVDGLTQIERKVICACLNRHNVEIKVDELAEYVAEETGLKCGRTPPLLRKKVGAEKKTVFGETGTGKDRGERTSEASNNKKFNF